MEGLTEKQIIKYQKDFWSTLNDRNKVSKNILLNHHVRPVAVGEKKILRIDVPADIAPGKYVVSVQFKMTEAFSDIPENTLCKDMEIEIIPAVIPQQKLIYTKFVQNSLKAIDKSVGMCYTN